VPALEEEVRERREDERRGDDHEHVERRAAEHLEVQPEAEEQDACQRHSSEIKRSLIGHGHPAIEDLRCFASLRRARLSVVA
jgi:hypothetical protein